MGATLAASSYAGSTIERLTVGAVIIDISRGQSVIDIARPVTHRFKRRARPSQRPMSASVQIFADQDSRFNGES
jgi:hypothetical protein